MKYRKLFGIMAVVFFAFWLMAGTVSATDCSAKASGCSHAKAKNCQHGGEKAPDKAACAKTCQKKAECPKDCPGPEKCEMHKSGDKDCPHMKKGDKKCCSGAEAKACCQKKVDPGKKDDS